MSIDPTEYGYNGVELIKKLQARVERLEHLHQLDHSLADQRQARVEALEGALVEYFKTGVVTNFDTSTLAALAGENPFDEHTQMWADEIRGEPEPGEYGPSLPGENPMPEPPTTQQPATCPTCDLLRAGGIDPAGTFCLDTWHTEGAP